MYIVWGFTNTFFTWKAASVMFYSGTKLDLNGKGFTELNSVFQKLPLF